MSEGKKIVSIGKMIDSKSEGHRGYGAGAGTVDTRVYKCPCGKGTFVDEYDAIPGFRSHDYYLNCDECLEKYDFDPVTGKITEK